MFDDSGTPYTKNVFSNPDGSAVSINELRNRIYWGSSIGVSMFLVTFVFGFAAQMNGDMAFGVISILCGFFAAFVLIRTVRVFVELKVRNLFETAQEKSTNI